MAEGIIVSEEEAQAIINPLLIFEVLSPSTDQYDRSIKFAEYQSLPTFKEYVLVRQDTPELTLFFREEPDLWRTSEVSGLDNSAHLRSVTVDLALKSIYHKVFS